MEIVHFWIGGGKIITKSEFFQKGGFTSALFNQRLLNESNFFSSSVWVNQNTHWVSRRTSKAHSDRCKHSTTLDRFNWVTIYIPRRCLKLKEELPLSSFFPSTNLERISPIHKTLNMSPSKSTTTTISTGGAILLTNLEMNSQATQRPRVPAIRMTRADKVVLIRYLIEK